MSNIRKKSILKVLLCVLSVCVIYLCSTAMANAATYTSDDLEDLSAVTMNTTFDSDNYWFKAGSYYFWGVFNDGYLKVSSSKDDMNNESYIKKYDGISIEGKVYANDSKLYFASKDSSVSGKSEIVIIDLETLERGNVAFKDNSSYKDYLPYLLGFYGGKFYAAGNEVLTAVDIVSNTNTYASKGIYYDESSQSGKYYYGASVDSHFNVYNASTGKVSKTIANVPTYRAYGTKLYFVQNNGSKFKLYEANTAACSCKLLLSKSSKNGYFYIGKVSKSYIYYQYNTSYYRYSKNLKTSKKLTSTAYYDAVN